MDYSENRPIYLQIADYICDEILKKKLTAGDRILSVRKVAVMMEVNPNTAIRAYHYLQDEDILYNERGVGYFVSDGAFDLVLELKRKEFIEEKLPRFYQDMKMLGIRGSELEKLYREHHDPD